MSLRARFAGVLLVLGGLVACGGGKGSPPVPIPAMVDVTGRLVDTRGSPVPLATVRLESAPVEVAAGKDGSFAARVEAGHHRLTAIVGPDTILAQEIEIPAVARHSLGDLLTSYTPWFRDADGDGLGNPAQVVNAPISPDGYVANGLDCDDADAAVGPARTWYRDADGDGYGSPDLSLSVEACQQPTGWVADATDCDDALASVHPGAPELPDGLDNDCDGYVGTLWHLDADGDGYGDPLYERYSDTQPASWVADGTDCDDTDPLIHPGAAERCNAVDDNCDGHVDEGLVTQAWYRDADGDGEGTAAEPLLACVAPPGYVASNADCDDSDPKRNSQTRWLRDADRDGYPVDVSFTGCQPPDTGWVRADQALAIDCDDATPTTHPYALELRGNGVDDDCDPATPDGQGYDLPELGGSYALVTLTASDPWAGQWDGWTRGQVELDGEGWLQSWSTASSDGTGSTTLPMRRVVLRPGGALEVPGSGPGVRGSLTEDARVIVFTTPENAGGWNLTLLVKSAAGLQPGDGAGHWVFHQIGSRGGVDALQRGTWEVGADGVATGLSLPYDSNYASLLSFMLEVRPEGEVLRWDDANWGDPAEALVLSPDKETLLGTAGYAAGPGWLRVAFRPSPPRPLADLAGDWAFHAIAPVWGGPSAAGHGTLSVGADGRVAAVDQWWSDGSLWPDGQLSLGEDGALRYQGAPDLAGHLAATARLLVLSGTLPDGRLVLLAATRLRGPLPRPSLDAGRSASAVLSAAGGSLSALGADGTRFTLEVPAGALPAGPGVTVAMAPVTALPGFEVAGPLLGAVQLSPPGLALARPAALRIQPPGPLPAELLGFTYGGAVGGRIDFAEAEALPAGSALRAVRAAATAPSASTSVGSLGGAGVLASTAGAQPDGVAAARAIAGARGVADLAEGFDPMNDPGFIADMGRWVGAIAAKAGGVSTWAGVKNVALDYFDWATTWQLMGFDGSCGPPSVDDGPAVRAIHAAFERVLALAEQVCLRATTPCGRYQEAKKVLEAIDINAIGDGVCLGTLAIPNMRTYCGGVFANQPWYLGGLPWEGVKLQVGLTWTIAPTIENYFNEPKGGTVVVSGAGDAVKMDGNVLKAVKPWSGYLRVGLQEMPCWAVPVLLQIFDNHRYLVTSSLGDASRYKDSPFCRGYQPPDQYYVLVNITPKRQATWTSERPGYEDGHGHQADKLYVHTGRADRVSVPQLEGVNWMLDRVGEPPDGYWLAGSAAFSWMGDWNAASQRFTGCYGTDRVLLTPAPMP